MFIDTYPPEVVPTLAQKWVFYGQMVPRAMLAVAYATGRASHARQVRDDDQDKKGVTWSSSLGVEREANNSTQ